MRTQRILLLVGLAVLHLAAAAFGVQPPAGPAYQIVLRSRHAEATPNRTKDAQTGAGSVVVEQADPNTIVVTMSGSAAAGSDCHGSHAGINFTLDQELEIIPTRGGVRPARIGMVGRVVGTLQVTEPSECFGSCGSADQGPASATLSCGGTGLLTVNVKNAAVASGQELSFDYRDGPVESLCPVGPMRLNATFRIGVNQGKGVFHRQYAVADFATTPLLDAFWADALRPFRAVGRKDFGFKVVVRVVEEPPAAEAAK